MSTSFSTVQAILQWPSALRPNQITLHLQSNTSAFISPYTRSSQTQELAGSLFTLSAGFAPLDTGKAAQARVVLAKLRGQAGRFYFPATCWGRNVPVAYGADPVTPIALRADLDTITADITTITADATEIAYESLFTADGGGTDPLVLQGTLWLNSGLRPLQEGSYISFDDPTEPHTDGPHRSLHLVVGMAYTPTTGACALTLEPPMLVQPTALTPIHVHNPSGVFRLIDDGQGAMPQRPGHKFELAFSAVQARPLMLTL
jgi:hypothetical protein